jgi:signal transduction histidine kinase
MDSYEEASGELGTLIRERGIRSEVGAPVIVNGHVWGALIAGTDADKPLPASVEARLSAFTELLATAVLNAATATQLLASRARLVAAGDDARRRIERDLHDGTQQRLVSLGLDLQTVQASLPRELGHAHDDLGRIGRELESVVEEVRELSRGLHPALLTQGGLHPALRALARRSPIRVELEVEMDSRPPEAIEIATYYVVSEALTNAAKHARASSVTVVVTASPATLRTRIEDDGVGGAEVGAGSGLLGLIDRVEALGGQLAVDSPRGQGTRITIELPLS